jgi:SNF2 family DNA or RNA helicase
MTPWTPHEYQIRAIQHLCANPGAAMFADPGLGKTSTTLGAFSVLKQHGLAKAMLVVAPLRPTHRVWPTEVQKWLDFSGLRVEVLHGAKKAEALAREADVYVINYDGLKWLAQQLDGKPMPFDVLVLDESSKVKDTSTLRYKTLRSLRDRFARVWALTGTPAPNGFENLFGQVYMLDGGERLGKYVTHFRRRYFDGEPQRGGYTLWYPKPGAAEQVQAAISDICLSLRAEDYLTLPRLIENFVTVELPRDVMSAYKDLEDDFIAELQGGRVTASTAAVKGMKLRQIVGGGVYGELDTLHLHNAKVDALLDLIEEQEGQPLLVAVAFKHEVERIRKALGRDVPYLGGGVSSTEANRIVDAWNRGEIPVLLAHPTSVAHGLNLQSGGSAMVWFGLTWSQEEHQQMIARIWRQGQTKPCVVHYIIADGTIDERVLQVLRDKTQNQNALLNALKEPTHA